MPTIKISTATSANRCSCGKFPLCSMSCQTSMAGWKYTSRMGSSWYLNSTSAARGDCRNAACRAFIFVKEAPLWINAIFIGKRNSQSFCNVSGTSKSKWSERFPLSLPITPVTVRGSPVEYSMVLPIGFMFPNSFSLSSSVIKAVCGDAAHDSAFPYFMGKSVTIRNKLSATIVSTSICFSSFMI